MEDFDGTQAASDRFVEWRINHPESFVVNMGANYWMLHLARCSAFDYRTRVKFAPKRASLTRDELEKWLSGPGMRPYKMCKRCKP